MNKRELEFNSFGDEAGLFAITSCCFVGFLFRYLRKSYIVGSSIDYGIPDAVGKCDAVTPFIKNGRIIVGRKDSHILWLGVLLAFHWIFFYGSIKYANVSVGVVCFCLSGFFTALISPWINRKRISWVELLLSSLTLAGISLIFHFDASFRIGIVLGIVSSLLFAFYATLNERVNQSGQVVKTTALQMVGGTFAIGLLLPFYHASKSSLSLLPSWEDLVFLILLALGCTVCMCMLLNRAQKTISAFTVSLSFNLEPVYSILLAVLLFDEDKMLGTSFYVGLSLIVLSLVLQMVYQKFSSQ